MRTLLLVAAIVTVAACSAEPAVPERGALWPHRDKVAEAFALRSGHLPDSVQKSVRACRHYWASSDPGDATITPALCDENSERLQVRLESYLGLELTEADVKDPALWRYVSDRVGL